MSFGESTSRRRPLVWLAFIAASLLASAPVVAQQFEVKAIAERKVQQLPPGPLFWRIDNFPTLAQAQAAAGATALAAEASGKDWLFTLGPKGRVIARRYQGRRNRTRTAHLCAGVLAAHQQDGRTAGRQDAGAHAFRI